MPVATDAYIVLQSGPDLTWRDTFKSRAYLAQKRRDDWSRVSPAVSEMMSRSGTRMSSRMSGTRMFFRLLIIRLLGPEPTKRSRCVRHKDATLPPSTTTLFV